jgi:hypothetical protein
MQEIAVVSLNSMYLNGESVFIQQLKDFGDIYAANNDGTEMRSDLRFYGVKYLPKREVVETLNEYPSIFIAATQYRDSDYSYLKGLKPKIGVLVHETDSFDTNFIGDMEDVLERSFTPFCLDEAVESEWRKRGYQNIVKIQQPYVRKNNGHLPEKRDLLVCHTRFAPSKHPSEVCRVCLKANLNFELRMFVGSSKFINPFIDPRISYSFGRWNWNLMKEILSEAKAVVDGTEWKDPHKRTQMSFLEAIDFGCVVMCKDQWLGEELVDGETALELTSENVERVLKDDHLRKKIVNNAYEILKKHKSEDVIKKIKEALL